MAQSQTERRRRTRFAPWAAGIIVAAAASALAPAGAAALTPDETKTLARVERYINGLTTVKTAFKQVAPDGRTSLGTIYISRPGKLRIEFAPPSKLLILTTRLWLVVYEDEKTEPQYYPLNSTPAGILVRERIEFGGDMKVTKVLADEELVRVRLVRRKNPEQGSMTIVFQTKPLKLVGWLIADAQGEVTRVSLSETKVGLRLDPELFAPRPDTRSPESKGTDR